MSLAPEQACGLPPRQCSFLQRRLGALPSMRIKTAEFLIDMATLLPAVMQ